MVVALVAEGPNSVSIPAMFWSDYNTALAQVTEMLGQPTSKDHWVVWEEHFFQDERTEYFFLGPEEDYKRAKELAPQYPRHDSEKDAFFKAREEWYENLHLYLKKVNPDALFTSYYGGCGECGGFTLETFEEGKPCVRFNLD